VRTVLKAPGSVALFQICPFEIETDIYPVGETLVSKTEVCVMIIHITSTIAEFEILFNRGGPVFVDFKRNSGSAPELKIFIGRGVAVSFVI